MVRAVKYGIRDIPTMPFIDGLFMGGKNQTEEWNGDGERSFD